MAAIRVLPHRTVGLAFHMHSDAKHSEAVANVQRLDV